MEDITERYSSDSYIDQNPDLHEADSDWKIKKLIPYIDTCVAKISSPEISILDVGGGAGVILAKLSDYIEQTHNKTSTKYCLDLSPGMLAVQKKNNPKATIIQKDITTSGLKDKQIDILLMIDVLEHVEDPIAVLKEIKRITNFAIFKVPLEDSWYYKTMAVLTRGKHRQRIIDHIGHINIYSKHSLEAQLAQHCGTNIKSGFTNAYEYLLTTKQNRVDNIFNACGLLTYKASPSLAAKIFNDYRIVLVDCS